MNKQAAIQTLRTIKQCIEAEAQSCYIGDETEIYVELDALDYAVQKIRQREDDHVVLTFTTFEALLNRSEKGTAE